MAINYSENLRRGRVWVVFLLVIASITVLPLFYFDFNSLISSDLGVVTFKTFPGLVSAFEKQCVTRDNSKSSEDVDESPECRNKSEKKKKNKNPAPIPVPEVPLDPIRYYSFLAAITILVLIGGIVAGLTIGLMSLDETNLSILKQSGSPTDKIYAQRIEPIRKNSHLLLVTLLLTNTIINETLPVLLHTIHFEGVYAVLLSTALIVVFGEIIPQAICSKYGLVIGAFFAWPVRILIYLLYVVAFPIAKLLDWFLGPNHGLMYRRAELKELVAMHSEDKHGPLSNHEISIVRAVLDLKEKNVFHIMTRLEDVFMLSIDSKLDHETMNILLQRGHSRVPIYKKARHNIIGVVLVKQLLKYNPDDAIPLAEVKMRRLPRVKRDTPLFDVLHGFEQGGSHMALVVEDLDDQITESGKRSDIPTINFLSTTTPLWTSQSTSPLSTPKNYATIGIVTLEDVIEELLGEEIIDETDVYVDIRTKQRVSLRKSASLKPVDAEKIYDEIRESETQPLISKSPRSYTYSSFGYSISDVDMFLTTGLPSGEDQSISSPITLPSPRIRLLPNDNPPELNLLTPNSIKKKPKKKKSIKEEMGSELANEHPHEDEVINDLGGENSEIRLT
ncbi:hypothetical protein HK096_004309, partial [Nowakowskiella sp. JEL0078]